MKAFLCHIAGGLLLVACHKSESAWPSPPSNAVCVPTQHFDPYKPDDPLQWRGSVLWPGGDRAWTYFVDGTPLSIDYLSTDSPLVNTLQLTNGVHQLQMAPSPTASPNLLGLASVQNPAPPSFSGQLVDLSPVVTGLPPALTDPQGLLKLGGAVSADFDGDGRMDLFVWLATDAGQLYLQDAPLHFKPVGPRYPSVLSAAAGDLDNDGRIDLVAAGATLFMLHNTGQPGALFEDLTLASGVPPEAAPQWNGPQQPPPSEVKDYQGVTLADIDDDGLLDVAVADMNCDNTVPSPNVILRNEGDFNFARIDDQLGLTYPDRATFDILMDRLEPGGPLVVWPYFEGCKPAGTILHKYPAGDDLPGKAETTRTETMRGSMGSVYIDANGDGVLDIWSSGTEISPVLLGPDYTQDVSASMGLQTFPDAQGHVLEEWGMALLDADMDGHPDVFFAQTSVSPTVADKETPRDRFVWQGETCAWRESSTAVGLTDDKHNCEAVQAVDIDGDGDTDIVDGCYGVVRLLQNNLTPAGTGRTVVLHGTVSNPHGVGAILITASGEQRLTRGGGQPFAGGVISESLRLAGGQLRIRWPSGIEQVVDPGDKPVLQVTEPEVVHLEARRVDASLSDTVPIEVRPSEMGLPDAAVQVTLSGGGEWSPPLTKGDDGIWRGAILTPAQPATLVLTVTVGTKTLAVRPRIFVR